MAAEEKPKTGSQDDDSELIWKLPELALIRFLFRVVAAIISVIVRAVTGRGKSAK